MLRRIISVAGPGVWPFLALAFFAFLLFFFAQIRASEIDSNGADATATIVKKYVHRSSANAPSGSSGRTAYRIDYSFPLPNGRSVTAWKEIDRDRWEQARTGQELQVRYSLNNPELHATGEREYSDTANVAYGFGWFFLSVAGFFLIHDIRKAVPWTARRFGRISTSLAALSLLCAATALIVSAHARGSPNDLIMTNGVIVRKQVVEKTSLDALAQGMQYTITYSYKDQTNTELTFTKALPKAEYDSKRAGDRIPVRYSRFDPSMHDLHSAELLDISFGSMAIAIFLAILALPFATWEWRRYAKAAPAAPSANPMKPD